MDKRIKFEYENVETIIHIVYFTLVIAWGYAVYLLLNKFMG